MSHRHQSPFRRTASLTGIGALALLLSACGSSDPDPGQQPADRPAHDTAAVASGAAWLAAQAPHGIVHNDQYDVDDQGLSVDVALALQAVGQQDDTVRQVGDHLASNIKAYVAPGYGTLTSAGSTAKAAVLAEAMDEDPTDVGGLDLVSRLEGTVAGSGAATGRVEDQLDPKQKGAADYANTIAQAYAVLALDGAHSDAAGDATTYLLQQQCPDGWFRLDLPAPEAKDQGCAADPKSSPDVDATAFAVRALHGSDDPKAAAAVQRAVSWLERVQAADGSFGGAPVGQDPNSNSTGLAGWVLGDLGETDAAEQAATWLAGRQLRDCPGTAKADVGAVAYDDAALSAAASKGITPKTQDQFRRASAQAVPALQWLPAGAAAKASC
ncbi:prenyltransferase/squalene oxidase repeat-containing protein [Nocardioides panaciterrulae]|uniref:Putative membrane protein n=1 Tax=Nocardioides panaciterrulae TaxID=661492 RepID=A0A7Y9E7V4_9ACTN|nr:prenyltransferase/squalene oxidase repeat-containing protein [Nocardioides panaciterrulae]NYD42530.1 putative membrane protein [Nocardioides panaciterrulae]